MCVWTGFNWHRICPVVESFEHGNEPSGSIRGGDFLDQLSDYQLKKSARNGLVRKKMER